MSPRVADVQAAKQLIWDVFTGVDRTALHPDVEFHGPAPIGRLDGAAAVRETVHAPLDEALLHRRWEPYLFLGGICNGDEVWVAHTGHITGVFSHQLFGIRPSGRTASLRYGDFARIEDGKIVEIRVLFDIVGFAAQAGIHLLPEPPARNDLPPGPILGNGLTRSVSDLAESEFTLRLVEDMLGWLQPPRRQRSRVDGDGRVLARRHVSGTGRTGSARRTGFDEFERFAQGPSVRSFPNRRGGFHEARFADGLTAAFTGVAQVCGATSPVSRSGGSSLLVVRSARTSWTSTSAVGPKLHENWVLIDLIDFAAQCGVDLLREPSVTDGSAAAKGVARAATVPPGVAPMRSAGPLG